MKQQDFKKIVRLGKIPHTDKQRMDVFCSIQYKEGNLSISGVEGLLRSGNARGGCGQIVMSLTATMFNEYAPDWDVVKVARFLDVWNNWHLNDMQAGTPKQTAYLKQKGDKLNYDESKAVLKTAGLEPDDGYRYGSKWLKVDVPDDVLGFLQALPDTDYTPNWV